MESGDSKVNSRVTTKVYLPRVEAAEAIGNIVKW